MSNYAILIALSTLVIFSYLFDVFAKRTRVPSVVLLLLLGMGLRWLADYFNVYTFDLFRLLPMLGTVGLILIVFEGALELRYSNEKNKLIVSTFNAALFIMVFTTLGVAFLLRWLTQADYYLCLVNALPFGIISSAIAIPSSTGFEKDKREFIVYESSFSDILGIVIFQFIISNPKLTGYSFLELGVDIVLVLLLTAAFCMLLLYVMGRLTHHIKFFLIISTLILVYATGRLFELSTLIVVLLFGLFLSNAQQIAIPFFKKHFLYKKFGSDISQLHHLSAESAFLIRTFFFVVFGFTVNIDELTDWKVLAFGVFITEAVYLIRLIYLRYISSAPVLPIVFVAPRGLLNILLFFSLPAAYKIEAVDTGLMFTVILLSNLTMAAGLVWSNRKPSV